MPVLSKIPCYHIAHPWTPSCIDQVLVIAKSGYWAALKIYLAFYLATSLLKRNKRKYFKEKFAIDVLRSTNFLAINAWAFTGSFCLWRYVLGRLHVISVGFLPGLTSSFLAIVFENAHRRRVLAVYMTTIAIDCVYRMLLARGLVPRIQSADLILFGIASSVLVRLLKSSEASQTSDILQAVRLLVGTDESRRSIAQPIQSTQPARRDLLDQLDSLSLWHVLPRKTHQCAHQERTCIWYALKGAIRMAAYGAAAQLALNSLSLLRLRNANVQKVLSQMLRDVGALGSFLGTYVLAVRSICCVLRRATGKDEAWHGAVAGLGAAMSMKFYRSLELSVFALSRIADFYYEMGIKSGHLPNIPYGTILLYTVSTAIMFHAAAYEPQNIKPNYWHSVPMALSGGKFGDLNRRLLVEGSSQSALYRPNYWPNYDPRAVPDYMLTEGALDVLGLRDSS